MDQIITLLTNLFNLTKVAAVTLPGLLSAGGLALILWPALPIDVIPVVVAVSHPYDSFPAENSPNQQSPAVDHNGYPITAAASTFPPAFQPACMVEHWTSDDVITRLNWEALYPAANPSAHDGLPPADIGRSRGGPSPVWTTVTPIRGCWI